MRPKKNKVSTQYQSCSKSKKTKNRQMPQPQKKATNFIQSGKFCNTEECFKLIESNRVVCNTVTN